MAHAAVAHHRTGPVGAAGRLDRDGAGELSADDERGPAQWTLDSLAQAARDAGVAVGRSQAEALTADRKLPRLINKWPLGDLPAPALRRVILTGHVGLLTEVAIVPDGTWLASAARDGTVRIWDPATGQQRRARAAHDGPVRAVAIAPDGTWLASGGEDGTVRIWDPATGRGLAGATGHVWEPTGRGLAAVRVTGHDGPVSAVAIAPDGTWLAMPERMSRGRCGSGIRPPADCGSAPPAAAAP